MIDLPFRVTDCVTCNKVASRKTISSNWKTENGIFFFHQKFNEHRKQPKRKRKTIMVCFSSIELT